MVSSYLFVEEFSVFTGRGSARRNMDRLGFIEQAFEVRDRIEESGISIYSEPATADSDLFYPPKALEVVLEDKLVGNADLVDLPVRTRSKVAKKLVCEVLGYTAPKSFKKVQPRLPHPAVDVYAQQANNLQIWNEELDAERRYVILILVDGVISRVRVIAGADLAQYDATGTLTSKFQAARYSEGGSRLVSEFDTDHFRDRLEPNSSGDTHRLPTSQPVRGSVLPVKEIYRRLLSMVGKTYRDPGIVQERNRGTVVHREACARLGCDGFADNGQFPDILSELVEVKLQLSRTVDLGVELPSSSTPLASANGLLDVRDVRYAIFYAERCGSEFTITSLVVSTGADFFTEYRQFGGLTSNRKLQLRLPNSWF